MKKPLIPFVVLLMVLSGPVCSADQVGEPPVEELTLEQLQHRDMVVHTVWWFEEMWHKGGWSHLLRVASPANLDEVRQALREVGADTTLLLLERAAQLGLEDVAAKGVGARSGLLEQLDREFAAEQSQLTQQVNRYLGM